MRWSSGLLAVALVGSATALAQPVGGLFIGAETDSGARPEAGVLRERVTRIDLDALEGVRAAANADAPAPLVLNLFSDARLNAVITWTGPTAAGYAMTGHLREWELGSVTLVVHDGIVMGSVRAPDGVYSFTAEDDGEVVIRKSAPRPSEPGDAVPFRWRDSQRSAAAPVPGELEDGSQIDVLVTYTPSAVARIGGRRRMEAGVALIETVANQAYRDSGVLQRVRVVHSTTVQFSEEGRDTTSILYMLVDPADGHLDRIHALRSRYAADIVTLILNHAVLPEGSRPARPSRFGIRRVSRVRMWVSTSSRSSVKYWEAPSSRTSLATTWACFTTATRTAAGGGANGALIIRRRRTASGT